MPVRASIHQRYPYDTSSHAYSDDNTTRLHFLASRRVVATDADYYYRQHDQSVTHRIDGHRFDYLLANESMKRQLLSLQVDDALVSLYENERWENLIDVSLFDHLHHRQLSGEDRARGRRILRSTWESIEVQRLSPALCRKFGYRPIRCSWPIFCWQLKASFSFVDCWGRIRGNRSAEIQSVKETFAYRPHAFTFSRDNNRNKLGEHLLFLLCFCLIDQLGEFLFFLLCF